MSYDDTVDMINSVTRDIAAWDLRRNGEHPDEGAIDDWIYQFQIGGTKEQFMEICKEYWDEYLGANQTIH